MEVGIEQLQALAKRAPEKRSNGGSQAPSGAGDYSTLDVVGWFAAHGHSGKARADGKYTVLCPWHSEHSDNQGADDPDTVVWPADGGWPTFHCSHAHCVGRTLQSVMELWGDADLFCRDTFTRADAWPVGRLPGLDEEAPYTVDLPATFPDVGRPSPKLTEGRQDALRTTAGALRRSGLSEAAIYAALLSINREQCDPPLDESEIQTIAISVSQFEPSEAQDWRVRAGDDVFAGIDPLRCIGTDPPRYECHVLGKSIQVNLTELLDWKSFKRAIARQIHQLPALPGTHDKVPEQTRWEREFVAPAMDRMRKRGQFEEAPEDAGERGAAWQDVLAFFSKKRLGEEKDEVADDRLVLADGCFYFRGRVLRQWLADNKLDRLDSAELWDVVRMHGGKPHNLRVKASVSCPKGQCACWRVPSPWVDRASSEDEN